jgi:hypothetical protein
VGALGNGSAQPFATFPLLARLVAPLCFPQPFSSLGCEFAPTDRRRGFLKLSDELELWGRGSLPPVITSAGVVAWLLIICGALQGLSLIGARHVPHFWLQSISRDPRCRDGRLLRWILPSSIDLPFATPASGQIERYAEESTKTA